MRINLRKTKPMKRDLVYTTDDWRLRPFDPTRVFAPSPHQNRQFAPPVEKVGLVPDQLPSAVMQARRFAKTRSAQSAAVLEDHVELISDLRATAGEARTTDIAARLGVSRLPSILSDD